MANFSTGAPSHVDNADATLPPERQRIPSKRATPLSTLYSLLSTLLLLAVFALYAPALGVALLHDDAANAFWLQPQRWANLFAFDAAAGGAAARPLANALWLLTRDLFGWFSPPIIHAWNIWLHVLNTALVWALARKVESQSRKWRAGAAHRSLLSTLTLYSPLHPPRVQRRILDGTHSRQS